MFPAQLHRCPEPVDMEVLTVFLLETRREKTPFNFELDEEILEDGTDSTNSYAAQAE